MSAALTYRPGVGAGPSPVTAVVRRAVLALEGVVAVCAFGGGAGMILDPTGARMGLQPQMLDRLPVDTWLVPGVALVVCNGLLPTATALAELNGRGWPCRYGHAVAGAVLLAWPVTETLIFGYPLEDEPLWLRPTVAGAGVALLCAGLLLRRGRAVRVPQAAS